MKLLKFLCFVVFWVDLGYMVDRSKFFTCDQVEFCKRINALDSNAKRFEFIANSAKCENGVIKAKYINTDFTHKGAESIIAVELSAVKGIDTVRLKVDEVNSEFDRLDVFKHLMKDLQSEPQVNTKKKIIKDGNKCSMQFEEHMIVEFDFAKLKISVNKNGNEYISLNEDNFLQMEPHVNENGERISKSFLEDNISKNYKTPQGNRAISLDFTFKESLNLYGLPEHTDSFLIDTRNPQPYRFYNLDVFEYEINERMALYGSVPFVQAHNKEISLGIFWNNIAETWVHTIQKTVRKILFFNQDINQSQLKFISESGIIDVFIMLGPTPHTVSQQFAEIVGYQQLPPLSTLGYHQCRWNYFSQDEITKLIDTFEEKKIPVDVLWLDIEHTDHRKYFTWNMEKFPNPTEMVEYVSLLGRKMVTIVDPHVSATTDHFVYNEALQGNHLVMKNDKTVFEGWCWPGNSVYPDFTKKSVRDWFAQFFNYTVYKHTSKDVYIWIDMNEPSVFSGPEVTLPKDTVLGDVWEHRDVHNIYGFMYHASVFDGLLKRDNNKRRPFVLTRSFYAGSQKYGAVWTGDNFAKWEHLAASIPMQLSLSISGIHFVGADVAGFFGNPNEELFIRWNWAAALTPFMRNHAHLDAKPKEPWVFSDKCTQIVTNAIKLRYSYLPYIYNAFFESNKYGKPIMKPLWFIFPSDEQTFANEESFLVGDSLLVAPVLKEGKQIVDVYFPQNSSNVWYDVLTYFKFVGGKKFTVKAPIEKLPLFQKGGSIIPRFMRQRRSASLMVHDPITLNVMLDNEGKAYGYFYFDDGTTTDHAKNDDFLRVSFEYKNNILKSKILHKSKKYKNLIERIIVVGPNTKDTPKRVTINGNYNIPTERLPNCVNSCGFVIRKPTVSVNEEFSILIE